MDTAVIQRRVDAISLSMNVKGLIRPRAEFEVRANEQPQVCLRWNKAGSRDSFSNEYKWFKGDEPEAILTEAEAFVFALPSPEETKLRNFMDALGNVIDMGRENGIDVAFVNPLTETMKKLTENVLTYQKAAAE